jgi:hypothetical protein
MIAAGQVMSADSELSHDTDSQMERPIQQKATTRAMTNFAATGR